MSCKTWIPKNVPKCKVLLGAMSLKLKHRCSTRTYFNSNVLLSPRFLQRGFVCSSREEREGTKRIAQGHNYTTCTYYLPYEQESIEQVENYNNLNNCIDSLVTTANRKNKQMESRNVSTLYGKFIQVKTKFTPLNIHSERHALLQDWNEVISIITDMEVVPEEADQVSFCV